MSNDIEFKPVVYACKQHPGFSFKGTDRWFRFEKHQLILKNQADVDDMDMHIEKYPNIGNKVNKVQLSQAEALVQEHIRTHGGAHQGPYNSTLQNNGDLNNLKQRDAALSDMTPQQEADLREKLASESELLTTVQIEKPVTPETLTPPVKPKIQIGANK